MPERYAKSGEELINIQNYGRSEDKKTIEEKKREKELQVKNTRR